MGTNRPNASKRAEPAHRESAIRDAEILAVLGALAPGEVTTYGDVAATAGYPGRARLVGTLLAGGAHAVPWWRVVNSAGRLVPGEEIEQAALLAEEGVTVRDGRVRAAPIGRFRRPAGDDARRPVSP